MEMVPVVVIVPPDKPAPAVIDVTVPPLPAGVPHVPSPRKNVVADGVPVG